MERNIQTLKDFIEKKYRIKVEDAPERIVKDYEVYNKSYIVGNNEIYIGKYDDEELKICSVLHELGHVLITEKRMRELNLNRCEIERECWKIGINEGKNNGIYFSIKEYRFMISCLNTYKK